MCFRVKSLCGARNTPEKVSRVIAILNIAFGAIGLFGCIMQLFSLNNMSTMLNDIRRQNQELSSSSSQPEIEVEMPGWVVPIMVFGLIRESCRIIFG